MKLNTLLFGLLMTPAALLTGCSDYEDTELESPQADANAIGIYSEKLTDCGSKTYRTLLSS